MMPLRQVLAADIQAMADLRGKPARGIGLLDNLLVPGLLATMLYRFSSFCYHRKLRPISRLLYVLNVILFSCDISPDTTIGPGLAIGHPVGVVVAGPTVIGKNLRLFGQGGFGGSARRNIVRDGFPVVGDDVVVFIGGWVFGPLTVGDGAWIGANAVVLSDVPAGATAVGNPARMRTFGRDAAELEPAAATREGER